MNPTDPTPMIDPERLQHAVSAAIDECWADLRCVSEDDNRYCNPPRTRDLTDREIREMITAMLLAALPHLHGPGRPA